MTTFILSKVPNTEFNGVVTSIGRVILDDQSHGEILECIEADAITKTVQTLEGPVEKIIKSAWRVAREKVDEEKFFHMPNEGYFLIESKRQ